ncbi:uncharacterized protein LOC120353055 isoform X2 [Nilaparvata lugens]|uniref:uncharacterized protein LOC120353055 isoform X2 n=1 Tax=Nilaparvata lugens TaxID=108931 RepID=UPI00193D86EC|nr:uncharacterized protein LOC120353055 isoform X2 [Nilaparvata lugens]
MSAGFICCRRGPRWMDGDVGGRRSGLLFNVVGNVLGLLVSGARWYGMSLYALDDVLSLAGDVGWSLSAFCGVRRDFNPDILGWCSNLLWERVYGERLPSGFLSEQRCEK